MGELWNSLPNNTIHIATDGSHKVDTIYGAREAVMTREEVSEDKLVIAGSKCAASQSITSLMAEQLGLTSGLLLLHIICLRYDIPTTECMIHIWIDNAEVLRQITKRATDDIHLKAYGVRAYSDMATTVTCMLHFLIV